MRTIDLRFMTVKEAAHALVAHAPATGDYYGTVMRARFATTRPRDVISQYERTIQLGAWSYGARLPKQQRDRLRCGECGATGCKLWREYNTFANHTKVLCGPCALLDQAKDGPIDNDGKIAIDLGLCDQIGWLVPAIPDIEGAGFWGYTSVPAEACEWWRSLPSYPRSPRSP